MAQLEGWGERLQRAETLQASLASINADGWRNTGLQSAAWDSLLDLHLLNLTSHQIILSQIAQHPDLANDAAAGFRSRVQNMLDISTGLLNQTKLVKAELHADTQPNPNHEPTNIPPTPQATNHQEHIPNDQPLGTPSQRTHNLSLVDESPSKRPRTASAGPSAPLVEYDDITAEVEARLHAQAVRRAERLRERTMSPNTKRKRNKRKRKSQESVEGDPVLDAARGRSKRAKVSDDGGSGNTDGGSDGDVRMGGGAAGAVLKRSSSRASSVTDRNRAVRKRRRSGV